MSRWVLAVGVMVLGCLAAGVAVLAVRPPAVASGSPESGVRLLVGCLRLTSAAELSNDPAVLRCVESAMAAVERQSGLLGLDRSLREAAAVEPRIDMACHTAGHALARRSFAALDRESEGAGERLLLTQFALPVQGCMSALLHGSLDAWVGGVVTPADFSVLVRACEETGPGLALDKCADALGHAAWEVFGSPAECGGFRSTDAQQGCGSGVLMQMYQPAGQPDPNPGVGFADVVRFCEREWPAGVDARGCFRGAVYAFRRPFTDAVGGLMRAKAVGSPVSAREEEALVEALEESIGWCRRLRSDVEHVCEDGVVSSQGLQFADAGLVRRLCGRLYPSAAEVCRSRYAGAGSPG